VTAVRLRSVVFEADDPLADAEARSLAINEVLREPLSEHLDTAQRRLRYALGAGAAVTVLGVIALLANAGAGIAGLLVVAGLAIAGGGYAYVSSQSPDVTVTGLEQGYWTGHALPARDGVVVYDATESLEDATFELERLSDDDVIASATSQFDDLGEFPVVMSQSDNVEAAVTETLDDVKRELESAERHTVEAPIVPADGPEADAIEAFATLADADDHVDVEGTVSTETAREDIESITELEGMAAAEDQEAELEALSERSRAVANDLSGMQETAIDLLNDHVGTAADAFGLVSYNFYCPDCQTDGIDSRVELAEPHDGEWYCGTCRSRHDTEAVVPRHRIKDDIVNPVWDQLWVEKDDQRREIYENIEDQKAELREREFEQRREDIRSATDRIRELRSRIRDLKTEAKAAEGKVTEIGQLMVKYERLHEERKREFEQEVESSFAEIDAQTDRILEETRNEEEERIERAQEAAEEKAQMIREDERRREAEKFLAEQQREDARTAAELQQRASQHDEAMDVSKRQHREEWMLKTRGRTSFSGRIDRMKQRKDRLPFFRASRGDD
jgi:hypothetical protein